MKNLNKNQLVKELLLGVLGAVIGGVIVASAQAMPSTQPAQSSFYVGAGSGVSLLKVQKTATSDSANPVKDAPAIFNITVTKPTSPNPLVKTLTIYNNSATQTVYPIIESGPKPTDDWLQKQDSSFKGNSDNYRAYLTSGGAPIGIPAGGRVVISVPFYSNLSGLDCKTANGCIDWWNAARLYLTPDQGTYNTSFQDDEKYVTTNPVKFGSSAKQLSYQIYTAGKQLVSKGNLTIMQTTNDKGAELAIPLYAPYQLTEYTFGSIGGPDFDTDSVDFDISYVDHVYMPVAMAPQGFNMGYTGTVKTFDSAWDASLDNFVIDSGSGSSSDWGFYSSTDYPFPSGEYKLPGTYNMFSEILADQHIIDATHTHPSLTNPLTADTNILNWWDTNVLVGSDMFSTIAKSCSSAPSASACAIWNDFLTEYKTYTSDFFKYKCNVNPDPKALSFTPVKDNVAEMLQHIYGWVPFNSCPGNPGALKHVVNAPIDAGGDTPVEDYKTLEYLPGFNPYVNFLHKTLGINAYAFSIDDAVGNVQTQGTGLIVTVGGSKGLVNTAEYDPTKSPQITLAFAIPQQKVAEKYMQEYFKNLSVCGYAFALPADSITIPASATPCEVTVQLKTGANYTINIPKVGSGDAGWKTVGGFPIAGGAYGDKYCTPKESDYCKSVTFTDINKKPTINLTETFPKATW